MLNSSFQAHNALLVPVKKKFEFKSIHRYIHIRLQSNQSLRSSKTALAFAHKSFAVLVLSCLSVYQSIYIGTCVPCVYNNMHWMVWITNINQNIDNSMFYCVWTCVRTAVCVWRSLDINYFHIQRRAEEHRTLSSLNTRSLFTHIE